MKRNIFILLFYIVLYTTGYSQFKIGVQSGVAVNFQTVNSFIRNSLAHQIEYLGIGFVYYPDICFNSGTMFEFDIYKNVKGNLSIEYMLKKVNVFYQSRTGNSDRRYLYDLNYNYLRVPFSIKQKKSDCFYYDFGIVNNFLFKYEKDKLYRTLMSQNIKEIRNYNIGLTAGFGFVVFKDYELFLHGETDITPFLLTSDYGGDNTYPFKFHNITMGLRYWFYQKNRQLAKS